MLKVLYFWFVWGEGYLIESCVARVFDDFLRQQAKRPFEHSFSEHTLKVTDIVVGSGGANAIIISASEDRTCKVWNAFLIFSIICSLIQIFT